MKKLIIGFIMLGLSGCVGGCTGLESLLIGNLVGAGYSSYAKPYIDQYLSKEPLPQVPPKVDVKTVP